MYRFIKVDGERGSAMVISMLALMALTAIGAAMVMRTSTEKRIVGHDQRSTQAFFNAEAGYGEVLARMADMRDTTNYIGQQLGDWDTDPGWGRYVVLAGGESANDGDRVSTLTDNLDNDGDGSADEADEYYPEILTKQTGGNEIQYPWAKVRYRLNGAGQVILFGDHDNNDSTPPEPNIVVGYPIIRVTAQGRQGTALRELEIDAVKPPFESVDSAIYAEDDNFTFNGTQFLISGQDWDPVLDQPIPGNPEVEGILTTGDPNNIAGALGGNQENNVEGSGAEPSVAQSTVDIDLDVMRDAYVPLAEHTLASGTYSNTGWGDLDNYTVVHATGDFKTSGGITGGGILIVDGDFECSGQFTWYGLVLVMGDINFTGGGGTKHIYGTVMTKGGVGGQTISGNADLLYSSEALSRLAAFSPYIVYAWREVN